MMRVTSEQAATAATDNSEAHALPRSRHACICSELRSGSSSSSSSNSSNGGSASGSRFSSRG
jgi:hypothetical protein